MMREKFQIANELKIEQQIFSLCRQHFSLFSSKMIFLGARQFKKNTS
jgi:hypothetical protein